VHTEEDLIEAIYPALLTHYTVMSWLSERCILELLNETIRLFNAKLVTQLPGECMKYTSIDTVPDEAMVAPQIVIKGGCSCNNTAIFGST